MASFVVPPSGMASKSAARPLLSACVNALEGGRVDLAKIVVGKSFGEGRNAAGIQTLIAVRDGRLLGAVSLELCGVTANRKSAALALIGIEEARCRRRARWVHSTWIAAWLPPTVVRSLGQRSDSPRISGGWRLASSVLSRSSSVVACCCSPFLRFEMAFHPGRRRCRAARALDCHKNV